MSIKDTIKFTFDNDRDIFKYFDPNYPDIKTYDEIADNIYEKIKSHEKIFNTKFIDLRYGYIFYSLEPNLLISFGVNVNYRMPYIMEDFWNEIKKNLGSKFDCYLWAKNKRAIDWLKRNGMKEDKKSDYFLNDYKIIKLCL